MSTEQRQSQPQTALKAAVAAGSLLVCSMGAAQALNPIQTENALPGNPEWEWIDPTYQSDIEGYTSRTSINAGQSISVFTKVKNVTVDSTYTLTVYRLGWYNGAGARKVKGPFTLTSRSQVTPTPDPTTGMVEAAWTNPYTLSTSRTWTSGIYVVLLTTKRGKSIYVPLIIRNDNRSSDYLFQASVTTWQAYNGWGGKSLYEYNSTSGIPAVKVSFDRPYADGLGLGALIDWELNMLRFIEKEGYDVVYSDNIQSHTSASQMLLHKALLSVGHDEYWSWQMRNNFEAARAKGVSLGFFSSNVAFWQIRLETGASGWANRRIIAYKWNAFKNPGGDPFANDGIKSNDKKITTQFRMPPVNRPENLLIGVMYHGDPFDGDIIVSIPSKDSNYPYWVYCRTNLNNNAALPGLLGYETDATFPGSPPNTRVVAHSPDPWGYSDMSTYTQGCTTGCVTPTATVFATGSMQWNWGLDRFGHAENRENDAAKQVTRNVLAQMVQPVTAGEECIHAPPTLAPTPPVSTSPGEIFWNAHPPFAKKK